jgi:hypothetical protein
LEVLELGLVNGELDQMSLEVLELGLVNGELDQMSLEVLAECFLLW